MVSQFSDFSQESLNSFSSFVADLLDGSSELVDSILNTTEECSTSRMEKVKHHTINVVDVLVNYTNNNTEQTQKQMVEVVDAFAGLMDTVVVDFKGLASNYTAELRTNLASKGATLVVTAANYVAQAKVRFQQLIDVGLLSLSRTPADPVGEEDCALLGVLCDAAQDTYPVLTSLASATGRFYSCGVSEGATVSTISYSGSFYNESHLKWRPYSANVSVAAQQSMKQRCLSEPPEVMVVGLDCHQPQSCQCGADQRCNRWYEVFTNSTTAYFTEEMYEDASGVPTLHTSYPLFNSSATPSALLGAVETGSTAADMDSVLFALVGASTDSYLALLLNDTILTIFGSVVRTCGANETAPGDPSLPVWSAFRSCDPGLRAVAQWLEHNRTISAATSLEASGLLWEVTLIQSLVTSYFFIIGTNTSLTNKDIDASESTAFGELSAVRTRLLSEVNATGAATRSYIATVGAQNVQAVQSIQDSQLVEIHELENSSYATLAAFRENITTALQMEVNALVAEGEAQKNAEMIAMATTAGWTIAVVFAILILALLLSAWGTIRVTSNLTDIIGLMEEVADMKVENLTVMQCSSIDDVARIQTAFQVMVQRLAECKSYIPTGVFEKMEQEGQGQEEKMKDKSSDDGFVSDQLTTTDSDHLSRGTSKLPNHISTSDGYEVVSVRNSSSAGGTLPPSPTSRKSVRKHVSVLALNVSGFMEMLLTTNDALSTSTFNDYIIQVHETVSQGRGNIDYLAGDQIFVTFNAHVPCGDPAGAAAAAALDIRQQLLDKLGERLKVHIGVSFGPVFASSVGYAKFKFMVTVGSPMKVACILAHVNDLPNGSILVDFNLEQRMRYSHSMRPVELLYLPWLKSFAKDLPASQRIFMLENKKDLKEDEWLYQVDKEAGSSRDWNATFEQLVAATSAHAGQSLLQQYLASHPDDELAARLKDRIMLWVPGRGIRV